jgi:hypothetical protein
MVIGTIVEGASDRIVIESVFTSLFPGDHLFLNLQPIETLGDYKGRSTGTGWKGVRKWCDEALRKPGLTVEEFMSADAGRPMDVLIVHLDADVAHEPDLQENLAPPEPATEPLCPPVANAADLIKRVTNRWMGLSSAPPNVLVFAIPAQDMENWVFAALYPKDGLCANADFECTHDGDAHPTFLLSLRKYGKHITRKAPTGRETKSTFKKTRAKYLFLSASVASNWRTVTRICSQAKQFQTDIKLATS